MSETTHTTPRFGVIVIGDEILSGKRRDKHFAQVIEMLASRGLELGWARFLGDEPGLIVDNLRETFAGPDVVFSFGGIGATPDDRTRQCAAQALGVGLERHPDGVAELEARFGRPVEPAQRLKLVEFPVGAEIIPNPVNRVPGFSVRDHHFVPGFPNMAWPMIEWVLDTRYAEYHAPGTQVELGIDVYGARESDLIPMMEAFVERHPDLRLSCLPSTESRVFQVELGVRGPSESAAAALDEVTAEVDRLGFRWEPVTRPGEGSAEADEG